MRHNDPFDEDHRDDASGAADDGSRPSVSSYGRNRRSRDDDRRHAGDRRRVIRSVSPDAEDSGLGASRASGWPRDLSDFGSSMQQPDSGWAGMTAPRERSPGRSTSARDVDAALASLRAQTARVRQSREAVTHPAPATPDRADPVRPRPRSQAPQASAPHAAPPRAPSRATRRTADVCLFIEGAYPFVSGGVSNWVHDLIAAHPKMSFCVVALVADDRHRQARYELPPNVVGLQTIVLQPKVADVDIADEEAALAMMQALHRPLQRLLEGGGLRDLRHLLKELRRHSHVANWSHLMNSEAAFLLVQRMFERQVPHSAFLRYFWSWRSMLSGLYAVLLAKIPKARVYHALSTGYAGLAMARATLESKRPGMLTEHGIYTLERRIEIALSSWLAPQASPSLALDDRPIELRDVWMQAFVGYSHAAYEAAMRIVTLHQGNQNLQESDGAPFERQLLIPNGVDVKRLRQITRDESTRHRPTVALIGRVVPLKDVKTFIRAAAILRDLVPEVRVLVVGARDEDPTYASECMAMAEHLNLQDCLIFKGHTPTERVLPHVDVLALTSLSEAQPLVLLEAGAAGIPVVATDVGACAEMVEGRRHEFPSIGPGGIITPLTDPEATAEAMASLLRHDELRRRCGLALRERVRRYYNKKMVDRAYRELYQTMLQMADRHDDQAFAFFSPAAPESAQR